MLVHLSIVRLEVKGHKIITYLGSVVLLQPFDSCWWWWCSCSHVVGWQETVRLKGRVTRALSPNLLCCYSSSERQSNPHETEQ